MSMKTDRTDIPVAIVGMACRLPGAENLDQYWQLISQGKSAVGEVPADRLNRDIYYHPEKGTRGKTYSTKAALLANRQFHWDRCPIPKALVDSVDNTHLLMTEVVADAFRHAGYDPFALKNRNVSVFIGHAQGSSRLGEITFQTYLDEAIALLEQTPGYDQLPPAERHAIEQEIIADLLQNLPSGPQATRHLNCNMVAGTVAKAFGLDGSWLALNSACASSLHAMLMGARALQRGRADAVIVGGASDCKADSLVLFSNAQTLTKDDSRPFDSKADGLVMGEGYVALVMKTLDRAIADGDPIQAVVRGLGVATDGRGKSLWAPRKEGQMRAMRRAYRSGADASRLQYLECHATATQVGDATELETLREVLEPQFTPGKKIPITSAKANIGHTLEAAGISGMIKAVLCMQNQLFPAAINIQELNPKVPWAESPFFVPMQPAKWETPADGGPRCAAVNAFGIGGLNMHVVIDEYVGQTTQQITGVTQPKEETPEDRAIAVIGMGCILPGADQLDQFWQLIQSGTDPKSPPPEGRWSPQNLAKAAAKGLVPRGGFITDYQYDWRKHRVPPKQVLEADPLQFMFLDAAEKALADAGYDRDSIPQELAGVVVCTEFGGDFSDNLEMGLRLPEMQAMLAKRLAQRGVAAEQIESISENFAKLLLKKWPALVDETGSFTSSTLASRISKTLDLKGGAVAIDSGLTSGMSGIALCIDSLLSGDNDLMICAAGQRRMGPTMYQGLQDAGLLSSDGQAKNIWETGYDGVVPGEGAGVVVLKRLADARRDGDKIRAVIRGFGVATHDNSAEAMRIAIERSSQMAGIDPSEVEFIDVETDEDPTNASLALSTLSYSHVPADRQQPLNIASATSQFGQLGGGGPIVALLKAVLESQNHEVGQGLGLQLGDGPNLETSLRGTTKIGRRGVGGVASWSKGQAFYLLLDDGSPMPPKTPAAQPVDTTTATASRPKVVRIGADNLESLKQTIVAADATALWQLPDTSFQAKDNSRLAIVADSADSLAKKLSLASTQLGNVAARHVLEQQGIFQRDRLITAPRIAFLFPGQGSQYDGMLRDLVKQSPAAGKMMAEADAAMQRQGFPAFNQLAWTEPSQLGKDVFQTQIAMLLADLICLAAVKECGIQPDLVLGHSYGEFPALYAAGVWSLDDVIRMTKARCDGILATSKNDAGLLATTAPPAEIKALIMDCGCQAYLANFNAPDQTVVGGKLIALEQLATALKAKSYPARILSVPAAFHTPLMAGSSRLLQQALEAGTLNPPQTAFISTVDNQQVTDVARIKRNLGVQLTTPVKYAPLIEALSQEMPTVFIEVGPQQTLTKLNRKILSADANTIAIDNPKRSGLETLLGVQALLECLGVGESPNVSAANASTSSIPNPATPQGAASSAVTSSQEMNPMDDIPHFDATERRRAKMRGASDRPAAKQATPVAPPSPPQPAAPPVQPPSVPQPAAATFSPPPISPPVAPTPPAPVAPSPAMPSAIANGSAAHYQNGSANGTLATPQSASAPAVAKTDIGDLEKFLVNFVVEQTGYPPEVVDLDADLEADLGIDSIKKAQLFGELQEYFEISTSATELSLDDFPTLRHVVDFLSTNGQATSTSASPAVESPALVATAVAPVAPQPTASTPSAPTVDTPQPATTPTNSGTSPAELESFLVNFVVEQTGYPPEVVDLDADLEADLGIDSIKKAQLFGELQEYFEISTSATELSLDDFPTLRHVVDFLSANGQATATTPTAVEPPPIAAPPAPVVAAPVVPPIQPPATAPIPVASPTDTSVVSNSGEANSAVGTSPAELESFLVNFVVEQTGYPPEVVDLDADLEADLGIDSIKKAQLFGELQEYFEISTSATELSLDDFPTLRHVLNFLSANGQPVAATSNENEAASFSPAAPAPAREPNQNAPAVTSNSMDSIVADEELDTDSGVSVPMELCGTPYEIGYGHGMQYRGEIRRILQTYAECVGLSIDELPGSVRCGQAYGLLSADQLDELQGIADAVEAPLSNLLAHHFAIADVLGEVEQVAATASEIGSLSHGIRVSPTAFGPLRDALQLVTFVRVPHSGFPHLVVVPVGTVLPIGGVNSYGLAATIDRDPESGQPEFPLSDLLERSADLEAACDVAAGSSTSHSATITVSDRQADRIATLELSRDGITITSDSPMVRVGSRQLQMAGMSDDSSSTASENELPIESAEDTLSVELTWQTGEIVVKTHIVKQQVETYSVAALLRRSGSAKVSPKRANDSALASSKVTARFELEMINAPISADAPTQPTWHGSAIVLGTGETASALIAKLQADGVTVYQIENVQDLETAVSQVEEICTVGSAPHLFITTGRDPGQTIRFPNESLWNKQKSAAMETPLFVCQKWLAIADKQGWLDKATVVATTAMGGDFGFSQGATAAHGGALTGLMKAVFIEYTVMRGGKGPRVKAFDTAQQDDPQLVADNIFRELASGNLDYEVSWSGGTRCVPYAVDKSAQPKSSESHLPHGVWLVTGGARGITAVCALELGKRYGVRLHLLGTSQLPQIDPAWRTLDEAGLKKLKADTMIAARQAGQPAPQAWEKVQKAIEIDKSMRAFAEAGVSATYHACDVSSRESLASILAEIRRTDGPIAGILHGAGIDKSCRFEKKRFDVVHATIGAKDGGMVHLAALTKSDPIRHFIGFGSIAGRLGSFGQADYCLASDLLCKLMGAYRRQRPWVRSVGFHWHGWDEVGMAARPETQSVLQEKSDLTLMPLAEGLEHLIREIEADTPRTEVLITERRHWQRFADGLGKLAESRSDASPSRQSANPEVCLGPAEATVELRTQRCELKLIDAPLSPNSPKATTFDAPVWILGDNSLAIELETTLQAGGAEVYRFPPGNDLDTTLAYLEGLHTERPAKTLFLTTSRDEIANDCLSPETIEQRRQEGIITPFFVTQAWYKRLAKSPDTDAGTLVAATSLGGDFGFQTPVAVPDGGGVAGFVKSIHIEDSRREQPLARCKVIDTPAGELTSNIISAMLREIASDRPEVEVSWTGDVRRVVRPIPTDLPVGPLANIPIGGVWVVTGGARGITAIAARELARRYGWKLHLFGKSPPPLENAPWRNFDEEQLKTYKTQITRQAVANGQSPGAAWDRVLKDCEIFTNLQKFAEAGVTATYHQCDVTSREELAAALDKVRATDGGVTGLVHGAGLIEPGRFEHKRVNFVEKLVRTKFDGLMHLLALTKNDPLTHCIGFGSISGRFGGNGLSDYAAGNDSMSKVLDWHRAARPDCTTLTIHWESWEGAGIATLSRFAWGPRSVMKMKYMLPEEGVRRLEEELAGGTQAETLYTFGDFYPMFYPAEQYPLGEFQPRSGEAAGDVPLIETTRREGDELVGDVPLNPTTDPFLVQHRLRGKPIMPVVATLEALREAAALASGKQVIGFRNVDMVDGLVFHTDNLQTAQARASMQGEDVAHVRWTCDFRNRTGGLIQKDRLYLEAEAEVADGPANITFSLPAFPTEWHAVQYPEDSAIYHGQPFRCLENISCDATSGWGHILAQPLVDLTGEAKREGWIIPSCVLDSALYACGCHLYLHGQQAVSLPRRIAHLELGRVPADGENCYVHFTCREIAEKSALYDMIVVGQDGTVILKATGYEKVILMRGGVA